MTKTYILNIENLYNQDVFGMYLMEMSDNRRKKIEKAKLLPDKVRMLGVGILLDNYLKKKGFREKNMLYSFKENGKPYFQNIDNVFFNASHSGNYAVCAFSSSDVGCDIECIAKKKVNIAKRFFTESEQKYIFDSENIDKNFIRVWTIKESYLKFLGCGLIKELSSFEILGLQQGNIQIIDNGIKADCYFKEYKADNTLISVCSKQNDFNEIQEVYVKAF